MFQIIENAEIFTPANIGICDLLICGDKIAWIGKEFRKDNSITGIRVIDGTDKYLVPGFIDNHVHLIGGGGEGGFSSRTTEISILDLVSSGITSVIGLLGTDSTTRHTSSLLAKVRALEEEGISAWAMLGSYQLPIRTLTGHIQDDIVLIDKLIGIGEIAISDHRSSYPTKEEIIHIASAARVAGLLSGKAGVVITHLGDSPSGLSLLSEIPEISGIPIKQFLPTHINRNDRLFHEAIEFAFKGGHIDLTTSIPSSPKEEGIKCSLGLNWLLDEGIPIEQISFSSDGQGSLPNFNSKGTLIGWEIASTKTLWQEVVDSVKDQGIPLETALRVITSSPADHFKLNKKGALFTGNDADMVLINKKNLSIDSVISRGTLVMKEGLPCFGVGYS